MSPFNIDYPGTPDSFVMNANKAIQNKGGVFTGNAASGTFSIQTLAGKVEGNYTIQTPQNDKTPILISITKKPFIVSARKIQESITGFF